MAIHYDALGDKNPRAERIFEQVVEALRERDITPNALNFAVWYAYFNGNIPALKAEMDTILADDYGYQDRYGRELFDKYLLAEDSALADLDRALRHLMQSLARRIEQLARRMEKQTQTLSEASEQLAQPLDQERLNEITQTVLNTAEELKQDTEQFERTILSSADEIKRLRKELLQARMESMRDELTGLLNRRAFNETMAELTVAYEDRPDRLHLIMTDIDHFKKFNDTFGHLTGDSVLRYFAKLMLKTQRENEVICRYGGEEFAIIVKDDPLERVKERAEELRHKLTQAQLKRKTDAKHLGTITASFGIGQFHGSDDTIEAFIERADKALYLAKKCGRNQVRTEFEDSCD
ncbi:GGDEF domain-containing protein [Sulfurivirga sp.]|uniref:GGDEF domain-containing protein n=1 Tax=Sulfurivirga sp. TaxID=2614236 RepID=UPI0025D39F0A|nr:GGDEF domain-containing protein [Sulfurivirga sp.]